jgi:hypothetical protein
MKNRRDILIIIGLFLALIAFVAFGPGRRPPSGGPEGPTTHSSEAEGALGLYNWAGAMGYDARRLEYHPFVLDEQDDALLILNPTQRIDRAQARAALDWVEGGGTLIFADDSPQLFGPGNALLDELGVDSRVYSTTTTIERAVPAQPALDQPPVGEAQVRTDRTLVPHIDDYVTLSGKQDAVVVAGIKHGEGYIYLSTATYPFTNEGLRDPENAGLVLNMLRRVPAGGRIQFDEYHHGYFTPPSTTRIVLGSPWGWAAAYALIAIALYLILSGRRFGRPVPLREEVVRRSSAEYVESMADLFQRGGKRSYILRHYYTTFKRRLAKPSGVNPQLGDQEFVGELARFREIDQPALLALLARLQNQQAGEAELVRAVAEADRFLEAIGQKA